MKAYRFFVFILMYFAAMTSCDRASGDLAVTSLRCEFLEDPLGIDVRKPRFNWVVSSDERGQYQSAYRIIVASSREKLDKNYGDIWDSKKVNSDRAANIIFHGKELQSGKMCYWKVKAWDRHGNPSAWSEPARWSMGLLNPGDWEAKWISTSKENSSPLFRKQFNLKFEPERATVYLASLGYFELYLNGKKIGDEVFAPAVSNFSKRTYYQTFEVSPYLAKGDNCIAVWMGKGWYSNGLPGVEHHSPVFRLQLHANTNRKEYIVCSDSSWLTHPGSRELLGKWRWGDFGGERVDARLQNKDWNVAGVSQEGWANCVELDVAAVPCVAQNCEGVGKLEPISPLSIETLDENKMLVDFGTNLTGLFDMKFRGLRSGDTVSMYYADKDTRNTDFIGHNNLIRDGFSHMGQYDEFISAGGTEEHFSNVFNYHAFRYAIIEGLDYIPDKKDITAIPISDKLAETGSFQCSNELYNRINEMVTWTYRCLNLGGQTVDCPHRERLGYGDGQTIMDLACYNFDAHAMYAKWSQNWWDEQDESGFVPFTAPCPHNTGGGPAWGAMCIMVPWKTYLFYNDVKLLADGYPYMKKYIEYLGNHCKDGILQDIFPGERWPNLGDWVPPRRGMDKADWVDDTSRRLFNNCYRIHLLQIMQEVSELLGKKDDSEAFGKEIVISQQRVHEQFFNPDDHTYANGEQPYLIFPLQTDVTPETMKDAVFDKYVETLVEKDNGHLNTGMIGTQIMTDYLVQKDRNDLIDLFVNKTTYPGWGYMIESGATTCWEQWNGFFSQIHSCFPYIGGWFYKGLAGIQWDREDPGFRNIILRPGLVESVDWVKCTYQSQYGKIQSDWKTEGDTLKWQIRIPANSTATVYIPGGDIKEGDVSVNEAQGVEFLKSENNYNVFKLESGTYNFLSIDK